MTLRRKHTYPCKAWHKPKEAGGTYTLPFEPHFLVFAAEGADKALRVVTAIHYRAAGHTRDHYRGVRSDVSAGIAPLLINNMVRDIPLVVSNDYRTLDSYRHIVYSPCFSPTLSVLYTLPTNPPRKQKGPASLVRDPSPMACCRLYLLAAQLIFVVSLTFFSSWLRLIFPPHLATSGSRARRLSEWGCPASQTHLPLPYRSSSRYLLKTPAEYLHLSLRPSCLRIRASLRLPRGRTGRPG